DGDQELALRGGQGRPPRRGLATLLALLALGRAPVRLGFGLRLGLGSLRLRSSGARALAALPAAATPLAALPGGLGLGCRARLLGRRLGYGLVRAGGRARLGGALVARRLSPSEQSQQVESPWLEARALRSSNVSGWSARSRLKAKSVTPTG